MWTAQNRFNGQADADVFWMVISRRLEQDAVEKLIWEKKNICWNV